MIAKCRPKPKREDLPYFRPDCGTYMPTGEVGEGGGVVKWSRFRTLHPFQLLAVRGPLITVRLTDGGRSPKVLSRRPSEVRPRGRRSLLPRFVGEWLARVAARALGLKSIFSCTAPQKLLQCTPGSALR
jgi:hypothetical protein